MKRFLAVFAFLTSIAAAPAFAGGAYVRFGPPRPPREIVVMRPSPRHVWVPGYYRWTGGRYMWSRGYWRVPPRARAVWVPGYWASRRGGYAWYPGYWR
jgi:hypothetical protein